MRNHLIHEYFDVDHDTVWITLTIEIPSLHKKLQALPIDLV